MFAIGCAGKTVYLTGNDRLYHLEAGQAAPMAGWLMSDAAMAELYDALERKLTVPDETPKAAPPTEPTAPTQ